jgi:plasmid stability protein
LFLLEVFHWRRRPGEWRERQPAMFTLAKNPLQGRALAWRSLLSKLAFCIMGQHGQLETPMATLTIRNVDATIKERLRLRAARHGRSMEAEARTIIREAVASERDEAEPNLAEAIRRRFAPLGGVDLELPPPEDVEAPPSFDP